MQASVGDRDYSLPGTPLAEATEVGAPCTLDGGAAAQQAEMTMQSYG